MEISTIITSIIVTKSQKSNIVRALDDLTTKTWELNYKSRKSCVPSTFKLFG